MFYFPSLFQSSAENELWRSPRQSSVYQPGESESNKKTKEEEDKDEQFLSASCRILREIKQRNNNVLSQSQQLLLNEIKVIILTLYIWLFGHDKVIILTLYIWLFDHNKVIILTLYIWLFGHDDDYHGSQFTVDKHTLKILAGHCIGLTNQRVAFIHPHI